MTPEQQTQHDAAIAERKSVELARGLVERSAETMRDFFDSLHAELDDRDETNRRACPHLIVVDASGRWLGVDLVGGQCEACCEWIPKAVAAEGGT